MFILIYFEKFALSIAKGMILNMDIKENILDDTNHRFGIDKFNFQTWEDFDNFKKNKFVFIFGIGYGADFYFENYTENIVGIIDNDEKKHGLPINLFIDKIALDKCQEKKVLDVSVLKQYKNDNIVILIANLKAFEQIAEQLEHLGICNYFSLLTMEAIRRKSFITAKDHITNSIITKRTDKIEQNKLVFYTTGGYFGHGKYIAEQLLKLRNDLDIVWIVNDLTLNVPKGIRLVYWKNRKKYIHEMRTAKIWIHDDMVPLDIQKRPEQIYVQVKHWSSVTLKTFGFDFTTFRNDAVEIAMCKHNSEMIDYIITGSKFDTDTCRSGFGFKGKIIQAGSSRSDVLFNESKYRQKICSFYNLDNSKKILLYAPTFRYKQDEYNIREAYETNIDYELIVDKLASRFSDEWSVLLRLHPLVSEASKSMKLLNYVIDASDYPDSQELVAAADVMITDYSSIMFEPAFVRKPVFLFAPDRKEYINGERKLLIDYDTLPFSIAESNEDLANNIENFNQEEYVRQVDEFMEKYGVHEDGHASERAAKFISDLVDGIRS
ncbi:CDP-glycerol glycerophosphotransferase family protein [Paenibacillus jilunlii]|uniref:CDP-glycerol glycerophosphotransferase family protein n=1 Tax=Paenibacillus jilunlii TaxID=682956 RepID=UPI00115FB1D3|nr:CDP-glycerol glycerophosphotransferase family protein [Paenibacillus jilunlii]